MMTGVDAFQEAQRRWTFQRAFAYRETYAPAEERCWVGYTDGWRDIILGYGATWEDAFRLADQTPIDITEQYWWGPHPDGVQQRHAAWCSGASFPEVAHCNFAAGCTCSSIRRSNAEAECLA
jgi:hypothetical protein